MKNVTVRLSEEQVETLDAEATDLDMSRATGYAASRSTEGPSSSTPAQRPILGTTCTFSTYEK